MAPPGTAPPWVAVPAITAAASSAALTTGFLLLQLFQPLENFRIIGAGIGGAALQTIGHGQSQCPDQPRQTAIAQVRQFQIVRKAARKKALITYVAEAAEMGIIPFGGAVVELH